MQGGNVYSITNYYSPKVFDTPQGYLNSQEHEVC